MREIVLDTETTGLSPQNGDRIVEIGCIELLNKVPTTNNFHQYVNPQREMPEEAFKVHGLSNQFLSTKPLFSDIMDSFLTFIENSTLIIHNASFDLAFINAELKRQKVAGIKNPVLDTVVLARAKFPGSLVNLDALCKRFNIDNSDRNLHGALLDAELLSEVYIELNGGRQQGLNLSESKNDFNVMDNNKTENLSHVPRTQKISPDEELAHQEFLKTLDDPLWLKLK